MFFFPIPRLPCCDGGRHLQLGVLGDGDPVDVVEIGSAKLASGWVAPLSGLVSFLFLLWLFVCEGPGVQAGLLPCSFVATAVVPIVFAWSQMWCRLCLLGWNLVGFARRHDSAAIQAISKSAVYPEIGVASWTGGTGASRGQVDGTEKQACFYGLIERGMVM